MPYPISLQRYYTAPHDAIFMDREGRKEVAKDIFRAAIEGDVECIEANLDNGVNINRPGQPGPTAAEIVEWETKQCGTQPIPDDNDQAPNQLPSGDVQHSHRNSGDDRTSLQSPLSASRRRHDEGRHRHGYRGTHKTPDIWPSGVWGPRFLKSSLFKAPPLHFAVSYNRTEAVRCLLAHGADPECRSNTGFTAMQYAQKRQYTHLMELMEHYGARK